MVTDGASLVVDFIAGAEAGSEYVFDKVLSIDDAFGTPFVKNAKVTARVDGELRGRKIRVQKFKRRKDYRRLQGHRQTYTRLTIQSISK